jgi:hypothetical protein
MATSYMMGGDTSYQQQVFESRNQRKGKSGTNAQKGMHVGCWVLDEFLYYISEHLTNDANPFKN